MKGKVLLSPCRRVSSSPSIVVTVYRCRHVLLSPCVVVAMCCCHHVLLSPHVLIILSSCVLITSCLGHILVLCPHKFRKNTVLVASHTMECLHSIQNSYDKIVEEHSHAPNHKIKSFLLKTD